MIKEKPELKIPFALAQSKRLFAMVVGFDGECLYTNALLSKNYNPNLQLSETAANAAEKLFITPDVALFNSALKKCAENPDSIIEIITRTNNEKGYLHTAWEISTFYNEENNPIGALCIGHDISKQVDDERNALLSQQMLNSVEQSIIVTDNEDKIIFWNRYAETLFGWTADEVLGSNISRIVNPSISSVADGIMEGLRTVEKSWTGEFMLQNKTGKQFPAYCVTSKLYDENGEVTGMIGTAIDLTTVKKAELLLDENRHKLELLSLIADKTVNAIVMSDCNGLVEWVNEGFTRIFGFEPEEILGKRPGELLRGEASDPTVVKEINAAIKNHQAYDVEIINYRKNGQPCWIRVQGQPIFTDDGQLRGILDVVADITEQKEWEEQLLFQAYLLDSVQQAVLVTDNDWNITYWNKYAEKLYGWDRQEIIGKSIKDLVDDNAAFAQVIDTVKQGLVHSGEVSMRKKEGNSFPVHCINSLVHDKAGAPVGCMAVTFDITEQKASETGRKKAAEILMRQYKKLKQFAHINAHDLRAPLTNILSLTHLLASDYSLSDEERKVYVRGLEDSAKQMDGVVRKLNSVLQGYETDIDKEFFGLINTQRRKLAVLVDDDRIQNIVNKKLIVEEFPNYDVLVYTDAEGALNDIIGNKIMPDIVFLDLNMPAIDGWEFLEELRDKPVNFDIQILTSSIDQNDFMRAKITPHVTGVTSKPLQKDLLEAML
jgi:PAS domain S-box-containing protein